MDELSKLKVELKEARELIARQSDWLERLLKWTDANERIALTALLRKAYDYLHG